ncbi:YolD-like family protein [Paenibacillus frigoriresistens]|uniref:YolD-like family protein n=1 Tax=Paenibacillus alginolyticus TaxID=59839 RepID=UPI0015645889|nr:YolD-like family protein [Paenibacillus frigoriresistens]NRF89831.1 YolD-like family protein [Paenibacillus frigoriresistens]
MNLETRKKNRVPPVRDHQLLEELSRSITTALFCELPVEVTIFGPYQNERLMGKIERLDKQQRLLRILISQDEYELVPLDDIIKIEFQNQSEME